MTLPFCKIASKLRVRHYIQEHNLEVRIIWFCEDCVGEPKPGCHKSGHVIVEAILLTRKGGVTK